MRITIIAASNRQPAWVTAGFEDYAKRLRGRCTLALVEVPLAKRSGANVAARVLEIEGERMLAAIPKGAHVVAVDVTGAPWSTQQLGGSLRAWLELGVPVALLIGGPDGLAPACFARAAERWALSRLTLPHGLARVVVAEALYRAWAVLEGHPYHRA
jgi:23S rRNA (pseudouridine1915-N3)-methyltransferase